MGYKEITTYAAVCDNCSNRWEPRASREEAIAVVVGSGWYHNVTNDREELLCWTCAQAKEPANLADIAKEITYLLDENDDPATDLRFGYALIERTLTDLTEARTPTEVEEIFKAIKIISASVIGREFLYDLLTRYFTATSPIYRAATGPQPESWDQIHNQLKQAVQNAPGREKRGEDGD